MPRKPGRTGLELDEQGTRTLELIEAAFPGTQQTRIMEVLLDHFLGEIPMRIRDEVEQMAAVLFKKAFCRKATQKFDLRKLEAGRYGGYLDSMEFPEDGLAELLSKKRRLRPRKAIPLQDTVPPQTWNLQHLGTKFPKQEFQARALTIVDPEAPWPERLAAVEQLVSMIPQAVRDTFEAMRNYYLELPERCRNVNLTQPMINKKRAFRTSSDYSPERLAASLDFDRLNIRAQAEELKDLPPPPADSESSMGGTRKKKRRSQTKKC